MAVWQEINAGPTPDSSIAPPPGLVIPVSPTLSGWQEADAALQDRRLILGMFGFTYFAAAEQIERYALGHVENHNLPVSATLGYLGDDRRPVILGSSVAQDTEIDRLSGHAEPQLTDRVDAFEIPPERLTMTIGVEPCLTCVPRIYSAGVLRAIYATTRGRLESMGQVKYHELKAPEFVALGQLEGEFEGFDMFQYDEPVVDDAITALFNPFLRDEHSEETILADPHHPEVLRFRAFMRDITNDLKPKDPDVVPQYQGDDFDVVLNHFERLLASYRH